MMCLTNQQYCFIYITLFGNPGAVEHNLLIQSGIKLKKKLSQEIPRIFDQIIF